ncbi:thermonuclease family protein [Salinibacterium xinjiangense]|uniref:thermonuclease family protein n=1 Tax=Salinibacterium xinjiangense TaxID=386302 RepID=UPI000BE27C06|nr:thermonuclease family protein [Salinibacterium xinjiangense]
MPQRFRPGVLVLLTLIAIVIAVLLARLAGVGTPETSGTPGTSGTSGTLGTTPATRPEASVVPSAATEATVEYVHDGDTLFLTDGRKVRMLGINTPEIGDNLECYGDEATSLLRQLLPKGTNVRVLPDVEPLDKYGRSLLFIYLDDSTNVNLEMLRQGAAEVEMYRPNLLFQAEIEAAEQAAIDSGVGMWGVC